MVTRLVITMFNLWHPHDQRLQWTTGYCVVPEPYQHGPAYSVLTFPPSYYAPTPEGLVEWHRDHWQEMRTLQRAYESVRL